MDSEFYQLLSVLQEIDKNELPAADEDAPASKDPHGSQKHKGFGGVKLRRWEEAWLRSKSVHRSPVPVEEVFNHFLRFAPKALQNIPKWLLIGPPGSGKSTLLKRIAWNVATGNWLIAGRKRLPVVIRLRAWERWASGQSNLVANEEALLRYLAATYQNLKDPHTQKPCATNAAEPWQWWLPHWRWWLQTGELLLLLDGLDELAGDQTFADLLKTLARPEMQCPVVFTCRTVSIEQYRTIFPESVPIFALAGLDDAAIKAYVEAFFPNP
jgi:predicted NACHT family NTPase